MDASMSDIPASSNTTAPVPHSNASVSGDTSSDGICTPSATESEPGRYKEVSSEDDSSDDEFPLGAGTEGTKQWFAKLMRQYGLTSVPGPEGGIYIDQSKYGPRMERKAEKEAAKLKESSRAQSSNEHTAEASLQGSEDVDKESGGEDGDGEPSLRQLLLGACIPVGGIVVPGTKSNLAEEDSFGTMASLQAALPNIGDPERSKGKQASDDNIYPGFEGGFAKDRQW